MIIEDIKNKVDIYSEKQVNVGFFGTYPTENDELQSPAMMPANPKSLVIPYHLYQGSQS